MGKKEDITVRMGFSCFLRMLVLYLISPVSEYRLKNVDSMEYMYFFERIYICIDKQKTNSYI